MTQTRKQKVAYQQRGASMRAMDAQANAFNAAVDAGELVITPVSPLAGEAPTVDAVRLSPDAEIRELKADLQQLRDRHEALVSALKKFGQHKADCECVRSRQFHGVTLGEGGRCTCGFRAALAKAGA